MEMLLPAPKNTAQWLAHFRGMEAGAKAVINRYTGSPGTVVEKVGGAAAGAAVGSAQAKAAIAEAGTRVARNAAQSAATGSVVVGALKGAGVGLVLSSVADKVDYGVAYVKAYQDTKAKIDSRSTRIEGTVVRSAF